MKLELIQEKSFEVTSILWYRTLLIVACTSIITNLNEILTLLANKKVFDGYGRMTGSVYTGLNYDAMLSFARSLEQKGFVKFGGYLGINGNTNYCARFAREVIQKGGGSFTPNVFSGAQNVNFTANKNETKVVEVK